MAASAPRTKARSIDTETESNTCPECGGRPRPDGHETTCADCGLVLETNAVDHGPEWRSFDADTRQRAEPTNPTRQGKGLGSDIGTYAERHRDPTLARQSRHHYRAKTENKRARNHRYAAGEVERIAAALDVDYTTAAQAKRLLRSLREARDLFGYDLDVLAATCLYTALRVNQRGVTPSEVAAVARADATAIRRRHTWLADELGVPVPPPSVESRIRTVAGALDVPTRAVESAVGELAGLDAADVAAGSPSTLAAGLLWRASALVTQADAAEAAGVTPAGVRKRLEAVGLT